MKFGIITLFPEMFEAISGHGVSSRAIERGLVELSFWNPRDFTHDRYRRVDDRAYGGGPGMVMKPEPLSAAIGAARKAMGEALGTMTATDSPVVYLSPQGRTLTQAGLQELAELPGMILLAGRYEGIDERVIERHVDQEWSIGDYVLSGGELAAMVMIDGITRLLPGALGHPQSAEQDSFTDGLLDCPHYTRPEEWDGQTVPEVLRQGDHEKIRRWRLKQALGRTQERRPELIRARTLDDEQRTLLQEYLQERGISPDDNDF